MRIDRIRLKDFGGVAAAEVQFAPKGVTIVHGPNEAGKSTLMKGINVLFDHRDDSRKEEVRLTKPVDRDVGSEVEADVEVGVFRFTYFKRFHKDRETRLTVHAPKPENLTGREAHDRVQDMLSSSLDTNLWRALRIEQGENLQMPELHNQPALALALDKVAGQSKFGEREEDLFEAARGEYLQYFTDRGNEKEDPIGRARKWAATSAEVTQTLLRQLKGLDDDVTRFTILAKETDTLRRGLQGLAAAEGKAREAWDVVSRLSESIERCRATHRLEEQSLSAARNATEQRKQQVAAVAEAIRRTSDAGTSEKTSADALAEAKKSLAAATQARDGTKALYLQAETEEQLRRADHEYRIEEFNLVLLDERLGHVNKAHADAAAASAIIASTAITAKHRSAIREAEISLGAARGILETAAPQVRIRALQDVPITIDGADSTLDAGAEHTVPVAESRSIRIGQSVDIRVDPGTSAQTLRQGVIDAEQALAKACRDAGVATPEAAENAWQSLQEAKRTIAERDRIIRQHLRDLTVEELEVLVVAARAKVSAYITRRSSTFPLPASVDEARTLLDDSGKAVTVARSAYQAAEDAFAQINDRATNLVAAHAASAALLEQAKKDVAQVTARLEEARLVHADDAIAAALARADTNAKNSLQVLKQAEANFESADPQTVKAVMETSRLTYTRASEQHAAQERELLQLRTRLDLLGEQGLAEALAESQRTAFEAQDALDRLLRRAMAAKLLFETFRIERDNMRRAYVAPLREGIERLGRHVYGPSMRVEIDETLSVLSRTIDGVTVSLEQLSTGAKEQMGLLVRLATAQIVAKDGGVPLILDDALGSTDETKFESLGAVLRIASQYAQTIILTCAPERYLHVGPKEMVRL